MQAVSVFITTTAVNTSNEPWRTQNYERMLRAGHAYRGIDLRLAVDPEHAELILLHGSSAPYLGDVCRSHLFRRHYERSYAYASGAGPVPVLPGMYPDVVGPVRLPDLQLGANYLRPFDSKALALRCN